MSSLVHSESLASLTTTTRFATILFFCYIPVSHKTLKLNIYITVILPVLYACEAWFLTFLQECILAQSADENMCTRERVVTGWK